MDSVLQAEGKVDDVTFADVFDRSMDSEAQGSEPRDSCWAAELVSFIDLRSLAVSLGNSCKLFVCSCQAPKAYSQYQEACHEAVRWSASGPEVGGAWPCMPEYWSE